MSAELCINLCGIIMYHCDCLVLPVWRHNAHFCGEEQVHWDFPARIQKTTLHQPIRTISVSYTVELSPRDRNNLECMSLSGR